MHLLPENRNNARDVNIVTYNAHISTSQHGIFECARKINMYNNYLYFKLISFLQAVNDEK